MKAASWIAIGGLAIAGVIGVLAYNNVSEVPDAAAAKAAKKLMHSNVHFAEFSTPANFHQQIKLVFAVQRAVLKAAPVNKGIPLDHERELNDLIKRGAGLCYDRSRAIETVLRFYGMRVRHVAIYSLQKTHSALQALMKPAVSSHAVSSVLTERGWMLVGSNAPWIGLTANGKVIDAAALQDNPHRHWDERIGAPPNGIFLHPFTYIYGLYSRHGRFYPPYGPIPDVNWSELLYNLS